MEQYRLEKTYKIPVDIFREGFTAYQKKFVYPKSYLLMAVFFVLALNFVYGAVKAPDSYLAYIMIVVCIALMMREWFNPRKLRRSVIETMYGMGEQEYMLSLGDDYVEFSTIQRGNVENFVENPDKNDISDEFSTIQRQNVENSVENFPEDDGNIPPSRIELERLSVLEYDGFFLFIDGKTMFYIVPKNVFSETETEIIRNLGYC